MTLCTLMASLFFVAPASAASLSLVESPGTKSAVDVIADTDGSSINSVNARISYPTEYLKFNGYQDADGVVTFWISPPHDEGGEIVFAGGILGGADHIYGGAEGMPIVRLLFTPLKSGRASFGIRESMLLLNDGKGTALAHDRVGGEWSVDASAPAASSDKTPPEAFTVSFVPRDKKSHTPAMIVFSATDESGIARYEVKSGFVWKEAQSPYRVPNGLLSQTIRVRAVDTAGNVRTQRIRVPGTIPVALLAVSLIGALASVYYHFVLKKKV